MLKTSLPEGVQVEGEVRLCVEADLHPDGSYGTEWLVVTEAQLLVIGKNGAGLERRYCLPLQEISEPKSANFVGGGAFEVLHQGERLELIRYTNGCMPSFATAAGLVEKWVKGEEGVIPEEEIKRCPRCGFPLEVGTKVCPACLPRSRALKRLLSYLKPHWKLAVGMSLLSLIGTLMALVPPYLQVPLYDQVLTPTGAYPLASSTHCFAGRAGFDHGGYARFRCAWGSPAKLAHRLVG